MWECLELHFREVLNGHGFLFLVRNTFSPTGWQLGPKMAPIWRRPGVKVHAGWFQLGTKVVQEGTNLMTKRTSAGEKQFRRVECGLPSDRSWALLDAFFYFLVTFFEFWSVWRRKQVGGIGRKAFTIKTYKS